MAFSSLSAPSSIATVLITTIFGSGARFTSVESSPVSSSPVSPSSESSETVANKVGVPSTSTIASPLTVALFEINAAFAEEGLMTYSTVYANISFVDKVPLNGVVLTKTPFTLTSVGVRASWLSPLESITVSVICMFSRGQFPVFVAVIMYLILSPTATDPSATVVS